IRRALLSDARTRFAGARIGIDVVPRVARQVRAVAEAAVRAPNVVARPALLHAGALTGFRIDDVVVVRALDGRAALWHATAVRIVPDVAGLADLLLAGIDAGARPRVPRLTAGAILLDASGDAAADLGVPGVPLVACRLLAVAVALALLAVEDQDLAGRADDVFPTRVLHADADPIAE